MNTATHDFEEGAAAAPGAQPAANAGERLDLKAYELWTQCHEDGAVPSQQELLGHPECEFVDHSVLIRIVGEDEPPVISHIGTQLWLGLDGLLPQDISEVPARSVLSRITEHYLEAVANRTAVGFEAEFVNEDGSAIGYRAIALPCASDGETIDAVLGVVDYSLVADEPAAAPADPPVPAESDQPMPKEGWRSVIAKMRREPGEPLADGDDADDGAEPLTLDESQVEGAAPEPVSVREEADTKPARPRKRQALDPQPESAPSAAPAPVAPPAQEGAIPQALAQLLEIEGALAAALVEIETGMPLASAGDAGEIDLDIAVAGNTEVLRAKRKAIRAIGIDERVEDVMVTLSSQYHLLRPLAANDGLFLCLVLDRKAATLAMARHELRRIESELET